MTRAAIDVLDLLSGEYAAALGRHPEVRRVIGMLVPDLDDNLVARFRIGFCDGSVSARLSATVGVPETLRHFGAVDPADREVLASCLTFPVEKPGTGRGVEIVGCHIALAASSAWVSVGNLDRGTWNWQGVVGARGILVAPSIVDALELIACGFEAMLSLAPDRSFTRATATLFRHEWWDRYTLVRDRACLVYWRAGAAA